MPPLRANRETNAHLMCPFADGVGYDAVNPNGGQKQSGTGKKAQQHHVKAAASQRFGEDLVKRLGFGNRLIFIDRPNRGFYSGELTQWIFLGTNHDRVEKLRKLKIRPVDRRPDSFVQSVGFYIADNTDNFACQGRPPVLHRHTLSDGVVVWPVFVSHRLANDHDPSAARIIAFRELAFRKQRDTHSHEVAAIHSTDGRGRLVVWWRDRASFDHKIRVGPAGDW